MITELSGILLTALGLSTTGTVIGFLMQRRHNKRMSALQEQITTLEVEKATIDAKSKTWHLYEEQLDKANERIKDLLGINADKETRYSNQVSEMEERFNKQTLFLRSVQRELNQVYAEKNELTAKIGRQQRIIDHLKQWLCQRPWKDCQKRKPQQVVKPTKYVPLEEYEAETAALIHETLDIERHERECECALCVKEKEDKDNG